MDAYYEAVSLNNLKDIQAELLRLFTFGAGIQRHDGRRAPSRDDFLLGVTYSRYEWSLEIVAHLYHHRGQLHAMLVHCNGKDPKVPLFE